MNYSSSSILSYNTFELSKISFSTGRFTVVPDLYFPINYNTYGINGVRKNGAFVTASFISGLGNVSISDLNRESFAISRGDTLISDLGNNLTGQIYENLNSSKLTISLRTKKLSSWNDIKKYYLFDNRYDVNNRLSIFKDINNQLVFEYLSDGIVYSGTNNVSDLSIEDEYYFVFQVDTVQTLDDTNYIKIYRDYSSVVSGSTIKPATKLILSSTSYIGSDYEGNNQWEGIITNFQIESIIWQDSIFNGSLLGMSRNETIEGIYTDIQNVCIINNSCIIIIE